MYNKHFIITGTSKGIGEQLAKVLLENGSYVYGISRSISDTLAKCSKYIHFNFDLNNIFEIERLLNGVLEHIDINTSDMICLINNAAMLEPLKSIDQCSAEEINKHIQTSLVAPMILTSSFIKATDNILIRRKIINISSGSGSYPAPGMSVYCTAKAGINMFTQCIGLEQLKRKYPIEIVAVDPGMVDTEMQEIARTKSDQDFEMAYLFKEAHQTGQIQPTEVLGKHLLKIIEKNFEPGKLVKYFEG